MIAKVIDVCPPLPMERLMNRTLAAGLIFFSTMGLSAQEDGRTPKPFFLHIGVNKIDSEAESFTAVGEVGIPVLRQGLSYIGVYAGGTSWSRGSYVQSSVSEGSLLKQSSFWGGAYWGDQFWTVGLAAEYGSKQTYTVPTYTNAYYTGITKNQFGVGGFAALHWKNGLGAFIRAGSESGVGAGLSLNF